MESRTKTGLLLLMIYVIMALVSTFLLFSFSFSINPENIVPENITNILIMTIPTLIIAGIGGLIGLIGAIFFLMGRKEFGEKHQKFVFYTILIFVISIVVTIVITMVIAFMAFSYVGTTMSDPSSAMEFFSESNFMTVTFLITPISAAIGGLIWIFALYQLENEKGRYILYAAYACIVITSIVVAASSMIAYDNFVNSDAFEELLNSDTYDFSSYSQLTSNYQWMGTTGIFSLIGNMISNVLILIALYIPYKRITSGELVPVSAATKSGEPDRRCPNCGRPIPFDANICPYCSKKFDDYL